MTAPIVAAPSARTAIAPSRKPTRRLRAAPSSISGKSRSFRLKPGVSSSRRYADCGGLAAAGASQDTSTAVAFATRGDVNGFEDAAVVGAGAVFGPVCSSAIGDAKGELPALGFEAVGELCGAGEAFGADPNGESDGGSGGGVGALARA